MRFSGIVAGCLSLLLICSTMREVAAQDHRDYGAEHGAGMEDSDYSEAYAEEHWTPPPNQSLLVWTFRSLGWRYTLALPLAGLLSFVLALVLVIRGGPYSAPALLFVVPIPLLVGVLGFFDGMIMSFNVMSMSHTAPKPSEIADGFSTSLVTPVVGMFLMAPAYLVAMGGLFIRAMAGERAATRS